MDTVEKFWYSLLTVVIAFVMYIIFMVFTSDKQVRYYYLATEKSGGNALSIGVDIDNIRDEFITLNGMPVEKVVAIIDSLNKSLKQIKGK